MNDNDSMQLNYKTSHKPIEYSTAIKQMEDLVVQVQAGKEESSMWFLEHEHVYTRGVSASDDELIDKCKAPVYQTNRGGKFIYHGPGQRVVYLILDQKKLFAPRQPDVRRYVSLLEDVVIETLKEFSLVGLRLKGNPGIWVDVQGERKKIAFIGIKVRRSISYHGIAFNISPDLSYFKGIIPCGIKEYGITSLKELGINITNEEFDELFREKFEALVKQKMLLS